MWVDPVGRVWVSIGLDWIGLDSFLRVLYCTILYIRSASTVRERVSAKDLCWHLILPCEIQPCRCMLLLQSVRSWGDTISMAKTNRTMVRMDAWDSFDLPNPCRPSMSSHRHGCRTTIVHCLSFVWTNTSTSPSWSSFFLGDLLRGRADRSLQYPKNTHKRFGIWMIFILCPVWYGWVRCVWVSFHSFLVFCFHFGISFKCAFSPRVNWIFGALMAYSVRILHAKDQWMQ